MKKIVLWSMAASMLAAPALAKNPDQDEREDQKHHISEHGGTVYGIGDKHWFERMDVNHDGVVSRDEYEAHGKKMDHRFDDVDANRDGVITKQELKEKKRTKHKY